MKFDEVFKGKINGVEVTISAASCGTGTLLATTVKGGATTTEFIPGMAAATLVKMNAPEKED